MANVELRIGDISAEVFRQAIDSAYEEIVYFQPNHFPIPFGKVGSAFVSNISKMYHCFANAGAGEGVCLKAAMVATQLLLQQPYKVVSQQVHRECLQRRLQLWQEGGISELLREARTIQQQLSDVARKSQASPKEGRCKDNARIFASLVTAGKTSSAIRMLSQEEQGGGVLSLEDRIGERSVRDILLEKHPPAEPLHPEAVIGGKPPPAPHAIAFAALTRDVIRQVSLHTQGSAGPSGMDATAWRRMCTAFDSASDDLCDALAACARRIASTYVDPASLEAYTACRLVPLDKQPGVRPIGIGEVVRRIVGKAIMRVVGPAIEMATGCLQLCGGQDCGIEAAIHAMRQVFDQDDVEGILFADASNAFNRMNRAVCLQNVQHVCPEFAMVAINTYRSPSRLFVDGESIMSCEGTTQGDPLAMPLYALAMVPLIRRIATEGAVQSWYADDSTAGGKLVKLRDWWTALTDHGPSFGYFPNASKSVLLVKPEHRHLADKIFKDTAIQVQADGHRYLGAVLGSPSFCTNYVSKKVVEWCQEVKKLATYALTQPQAAYTALTYGLRHKWSFIARTIPGTADQFKPLEEVIKEYFIPALTGCMPPGDLDRLVFALPCRDGGLGLINPCSLSSQFDSSVSITIALVERIIQQDHSMSGVAAATSLAKSAVRSASRRQAQELAVAVRAKCDQDRRRILELASEKSASSWLTCCPLKRFGFILHKGAFRDALALRYGWLPSRLPSTYACGKRFDVAHALSCSTGGYPAMRHNELRNTTALLLREVAKDVSIEPPLQPLTGERLRFRSAILDDGARLDIAASGVWGSQFERTFFHIRVFNPHAVSNSAQSLPSTYHRH